MDAATELAGGVLIIKAKFGELKLSWRKTSRYEAPDICNERGGGVSKCDAHLIGNIFCSRPAVIDKDGRVHFDDNRRISFVDELIARGYDITTIKFSIKKLKEKE